MANSFSYFVKRPPAKGENHAGDNHPDEAQHTHVESSLIDEPLRVLKHGDTFALFDRYGDIQPGSGGQGLYHEGTRFLSCLMLQLEGARPFFLGSTIRDDNDQLTVSLTNRDLCRNGRVHLPMCSLYLGLRKFLWHSTCHQELRIENHGTQAANVALTIRFGADFADIYEVQGLKRTRRGHDRDPEISDGRITLDYQGLDNVVRRTILNFTPRPAMLDASSAGFDLELLPRQTTVLYLAIACERRRDRSSGISPVLFFDQARAAGRAALKIQKQQACYVQTSHGQFDAWIKRAASDLGMMTTNLPTGPYPYAGVPWFNTPFGRDGIITALECLWLQPSLARGVLSYLASTQATEIIPEQDAEPGKILHETRNGEMAALGEMPFARYYGSVDATPLFVQLAGAYYERSGDRQFIEEIWPNVEAAITWMQEYGDRDGDGFLEYKRQTTDGLIHQGWKDSDDAVFHADGSPARAPIALCEVQAYAYAAWQSAAMLADLLGHSDQAEAYNSQAEILRNRFEDAFWCDDLSTYALALDGDKRACRVRTSNAGHCLFSGIVLPGRARHVARTLLAPDSFSGWGIRCLSSKESRYNPMGYHNGAVWPHDNALIAYGFSRYGLAEESAQVFDGMFDAALCFDLHRVPELFCGLERQEGEEPILYPVACAPQAWSAASVFLLLQAYLGLNVSAIERKISFVRPLLPRFLNEARILNLQVGEAIVDLTLARHDEHISVDVIRKEGNVEIVVAV